MAPGDWLSWSPTWTATTANPAIGNGSLTGSYMQIGKTVHFRMRLLAGSTTTFGTGAWEFTMPVTAATANVRALVFPAIAFDSSAANWYVGHGHSQSATLMRVIYHSSLVNYSGPATPMTWATSDTLNVCGTYDAA